MKLKLLLLFVVLFSLQTNAQTVTALQQQNARASGYAIVAARNPGKSFSVYMIKWDGVHDLEYNANNQINPSWHPQAVVKGQYFDQVFDGTDFTPYSSVLISQTEFDTYKSTGTDWWIVCSTLPSFSNSGLAIADNGNVGIGTSSPSSLLTLRSIGDNAVITLNRQGQWASVASGLKLTTNDAGTDYWNFGMFPNSTNTLHIGKNGNSSMSILENGNVGIGDSDPQSKLSLKEGGQYLNFITNKKLAGTWPPVAESTTMTIQSSGNSAGNLAFATGNSEAMRIIPNGNVGIGTTTPDKKLTVNGTIHSTEIIVDTAIMPDYVFQKYNTGKSELKSDYVMPTLAEIESFTKKNHHLPNVPSAQEVQQNGVSLGTMSNVLLQKVEELTLYAIEQQKKLEVQNKTIETLAARLASLEKK